VSSQAVEPRDPTPAAALDRLLHEPARLIVATLLYAVESADFLYLLRESGLSKGNLSAHLSRLETAGYVDYPEPDIAFWEIERAENNRWEPIDFRLPFVESGTEVCRVTFYEAPVGLVKQLPPGFRRVHRWNQRVCTFKSLTAPFPPARLGPGRYRLCLPFSLGTVTRDSRNEPWKRPLDLGAVQRVYSRPFSVQ